MASSPTKTTSIPYTVGRIAQLEEERAMMVAQLKKSQSYDPTTTESHKSLKRSCERWERFMLCMSFAPAWIISGLIVDGKASLLALFIAWLCPLGIVLAYVFLRRKYGVLMLYWIDNTPSMKASVKSLREASKSYEESLQRAIDHWDSQIAFLKQKAAQIQDGGPRN